MKFCIMNEHIICGHKGDHHNTMSKYLIEQKEAASSGTKLLLEVSIFLYIICAYAFEWSPDTSKYSTIAVYIVFLIGIVYISMDKRLTLNIYTGSMAILCIYICIMTQVGASKSRAYENAYDYLTCSVLCYIIFHITLIDDTLPKYLIWGFIVGAVLLSLRLIKDYGGFMNILTQGADAKEFRIGKGFMNSNTLGLYMATSILCALIVLYAYKFGKIIKMVICASAFIFTFLLIMSGSKKAMIFFVLTVLAGGFYRMREANDVKRISIFVGLILLIVFFYQFLKKYPAFHTIGNRMINLFDTIKSGSSDTETDAMRFYMIREGWSEFLNNPLFGNGAGHSFTMFSTYSHNNYIELLMNYGLIGFGLYYVHYISLIPNLFKLVKKRDIIAAYFLFYILFQLFLSFGWVVYYERIPQINVATAWGYVLYCQERDSLHYNNEFLDGMNSHSLIGIKPKYYSRSMKAN